MFSLISQGNSSLSHQPCSYATPPAVMLSEHACLKTLTNSANIIGVGK